MPDPRATVRDQTLIAWTRCGCHEDAAPFHWREDIEPISFLLRAFERERAAILEHAMHTKSEHIARRKRATATAVTSSFETTPPDLEPIDINELRALVGGSKPLSKATIYREIARGNLPKGVLVAPNSVRWLRSEIEELLQKAFAGRAPPDVPSP